MSILIESVWVCLRSKCLNVPSKQELLDIFSGGLMSAIIRIVVTHIKGSLRNGIMETEKEVTGNFWCASLPIDTVTSRIYILILARQRLHLP